MKCVVYAEQPPDAETLSSAVRKRIPDQRIQVHDTLSSLLDDLRKEHYRIEAAILSTNAGTLESLLAHRELLMDIPVILILSERDDDTITLAHKFYPRFVAHGETASEDVAAVFQKMKRRSGTETDPRPLDRRKTGVVDPSIESQNKKEKAP